MADSTEGSKNFIRLEEESEGNSIGTSNFIFRKIIGSSVPLTPSDSSFDFETAPSHVSERFCVVFLAHSERALSCTDEGCHRIGEEDIRKQKGSSSIQKLSAVDVTIGRVSILVLSLRH